MGWAIQQIQSVDYGSYDFFNANCQDFALYAFKLIQNPTGRLKKRYASAAILGVIPVTGLKK